MSERKEDETIGIDLCHLLRVILLADALQTWMEETKGGWVPCRCRIRPAMLAPDPAVLHCWTEKQWHFSTCECQEGRATDAPMPRCQKKAPTDDWSGERGAGRVKVYRGVLPANIATLIRLVF